MYCVVALVGLVIAMIVYYIVQYQNREREDPEYAGLVGVLTIFAMPYFVGSCICMCACGVIAYMAMRGRGANSGSAINAGAGVVVCCLCTYIASFVLSDIVQQEQLKTAPKIMMPDNATVDDNGQFVIAAVTPTPTVK